MRIIPPFKQFAHLPGVSVLCPTYGRTQRLPGLVESFLRQDYQGPHELIILNDRADQAIQLMSTAGTMFAVNVEQRFDTLGDKRNTLLELAHYPYVAWWDDDDRFLPNRLTKGISLIREGYRGSQEMNVWLDTGADVPALKRTHSPLIAAIVEKQAIIEAGGFPKLQMRQDIGLMEVLVHKLHAFSAEEDTGTPTAIYRKPGTSTHAHVTAFTGQPTDNEAARRYMQVAVDQRIASGAEPSGLIPIHPKWERDYVAWCAAAVGGAP